MSVVSHMEDAFLVAIPGLVALVVFLALQVAS